MTKRFYKKELKNCTEGILNRISVLSERVEIGIDFKCNDSLTELTEEIKDLQNWIDHLYYLNLFCDKAIED